MQRRQSSRARAVYIWLMAPLLGFAVFLAVFVSWMSPVATAATSSNLNFQARLLGSSGTIVTDGTYNIDFKLYNADSTTGSVGTCTGACLWEETRKNSNSQGVQVINGYFSVNLGSVTSFPAINWDQPLWLTMNIGGTTSGASPTWDGEMQNSGHSIALTALPYAFVAAQLAKTDGSGNRGTLGFNTVANNPNILLPDASGTVCLQAATACGFESTTGNDFIQNQNASTQTANFNISGTGQIATAVQVPLVQTADSSSANTATILLRSGDETGSSKTSGDVTIRTGNSAGGTNSSSGNVSIDVGTKSGTGTTGSVSIGTTNASSITIGNTSQSGATTITAGSGGISLGANTSLASGKTLSASNNSATGVQFSDSSSSKSVLTVDTSGDQVLLGKAGASGLTGKLTFNNATNSNTVSVQSGTTTSSYSLTLPTTLPGSTQCLQGDNSGVLSFTTCVTSAAVNTIGTYTNCTAYNNGANITGSTLTLGCADATHPGLIDASTQTFGGNKTFNGNVTVGPGGASLTAFQVQDGSNIDLFDVNTTDGYVINNGTADLGNVIQNPGFEAGGTTEASGWYTPSGSQVITTDAANAHGGNRVLEITGNSNTHAVTTKYFAVHPGDTVYVEAYVKNSGGANGDAGIYTEFTDKDKGSASFTTNDTGLPGTSYILKSNTITVPAGKYYVRIAASVKATSSTGTFYFDDFYLKKVNEQAPLLLTNVSTTAFQVQNSGGATVLGVDTTNSKIFSTIADGGTAIGFTFNTPSYTTSGAKLLSVQNNNAEKFAVDKDGKITNSGGIAAGGDVTTTGNISAGSGKQFQINGTQISSADLSNNSDLAKLSGTGPQIFTGNNKFSGTVLVANNNAAGFQVQHGSVNVMTIDTSGDKVILGTSGGSGLTGKEQYNYNGSTGSITITALDPSSSTYTLSLPAETGTFCTSAATSPANCTNFASAASLTSGLATKLNKGSVDTSSAAVTAVQGNLYAFTNSSSSIASGVLKLDNGSNTGNALYVTGTNDYSSGSAYIVVNNTNAGPTGNLIDLQSNAADKFTVDAAGNVFANGNINIASGKFYEVNGTQISTSNLSDGNTLAKLGANQTFTGNNTFSSASNSFTGDGSGLTNLNASNVASGTLNDGRLSSNVALLNRTGQSFTGDNTFAPTSNNAGTTIKQTSGTATSGSVLDVQTANGTSHFLQITNAAANEGAVTLQSVGATRDLTLGAGSGTIFVAAASNTIQHNNSSLTIDVDNGTDSTLTITNAQGSAVASLSVEGDIAVGAARVYKVGATSGTSTTCSSNTFSQNQVTNGGIVTSQSCANAVTSISSAGGSIANGASISGNALTLGYADTSNPGLVSNTTQSFNGAKTFTNDLLAKSNSATAFQVQNTSARSMFVVDTSGNAVTVGNTTDGAQVVLGSTGNANGAVEKTMVVNGSVSANDLVEIDTGNAGQVKQASANSTKIFGVATSAVGSGSSQNIVIGGIYQVNANSSGGTINIGDTLVSSSTAGQATKSGSTTSSGSVVGLALSTLSSGKVWVYINLGLGGSDNLQTVYNKDAGGTTPDLKVSSTVGGIDIQDADTATNGSLLTVRGSNSSGLGPAILDVQSSNPITDITNNANNNLVTNGSIENGVTGWAKMGSTQAAVTQDSTKKYIGSSSLKIVTNATDSSGTDGASYNLTTSTLVSNTQYTMIVYARTDDGTSMSSTFQMGRAENGSTNTDCLGSAQSVSANWTQYTCTFTTGTTSSTPYIYVRQTDQVARTFYIDGILLYRTSLLSNQFADQTFAAGDWQAKGSATVSRDTSQNQAGAGTASVKIATSTNASNNDGVKHNITLNDSTFYRLSFYALLDSGSTALSTMEAGYSSDGSTDNTVCITGQTVTTTWTQYSCSFTTPSSHSGTPFFYVKELNTTGVKTFYIDAVTLSIGNPLNTYGEGVISLNGIINSPISLQNQSNSTTAFQVQNISGSNLFNIDTANTAVTITAGTINTTLALGDLAAGSIGSAASTVDIYTGFSIAPTASGRTYTIPTPTLSTAYGHTIYISNIGSGTNYFLINNIRIPPGSTGTLVWSNTSGGASWQFAGAGGSSIENQNTNDQPADFRINGTGRANTSFTSPLFDSITGGLSLGTSTATSVTIGNTANSTGTTLKSQNSSTAFQVQNSSSRNLLLVDASGNNVTIGNSTDSTTLTIGSVAGSGLFKNNGATVNTTLALGDLAAGSIGSAATTVDIYSSFSIAPTSSNRTYTLPSPTANTTYGRTIYIGNIASAGNYFVISGIRIPPGSTGTLMWSNTSGGDSWQFAGAGGSSIENQNTADQVADFRINGTGRANTSFITPLVDSITGGLSIGTSTATSVTIGSTSNTTGTTHRSTDNASAFQVQDVAGVNILGIGTALDSNNFIPNSSFESAISGWTVTAGASAQDTTASNAYSGLATYKMNTAGTSNQSGVYYSNTALTNGQQYSISVEVKSVSGSFTTFEMGWRTSGGTFNNCNSAGGTINTAMVPASGTSVGTSGWTRFTCVLTPNATGGNVYFRLSAAATQQWYIDSVFVEATSSGAFKGFEEGTAQLAGTVQSAVVFRNTNDSTTALQVQSSNGTNVLAVDTLNGQVVIGSKTSDPSICTNGGIYYNSSTNRFKGCENGTWITIDSFVSVNSYTSGDNSWSMPVNASVIQVILIGGGGGGGGGGARNGGQERNGGGGGGGGAYAMQVFSSADIASTAHASVGTGGGGGAGAAASANPGTSGTAGGASCFSSAANCTGTIYVESYGGGGGGGGNQAGTAGGAGAGGGGTAAVGSSPVNTTNTGGAGGLPGAAGANTNATGGNGGGGGTATSGGAGNGNAGGAAEYGGAGGGGAAAGNSTSGAGGSSLHGAGAGGAGASTNSGNSTGTGGAGGVSQSNTSGGGGAAGTSGAACNAGGDAPAAGSSTTSIKAGSGGGGGGANGGGNAVGCAGGAGGAPGGGGGGGGSGSGSAGTGGAGGAGKIWVIAW